MAREDSFADFFAASVAQLGCHRTFSALSQICKTTLLLCATMTLIIFAAGLLAGVTLDLLLLRTLLAPPFRIWPTPEPGSWQSLTFWGLFRGGMVLTFVTAALDWNSTPLLNWTRFIPGVPLGLIGLFITVCG